ALDTYSPVRVSPLMISPSCTNKGTRTTAPDSNFAGLPPLPAVSPFKPGSVSTIFKFTKVGGTTKIGAPFHKVSLQSDCSFNQILASATSASCKANCSNDSIAMKCHSLPSPYKYCVSTSTTS